MNYREEVKRTCPQIATDPFATKLELGCMGLFGEAGEFVDLAKKHLFHGKPWEKEKALKELGDVYWYLEYLRILHQMPESFAIDDSIVLPDTTFEKALKMQSLNLGRMVGMVIDNAHYYLRRGHQESLATSASKIMSMDLSRVVEVLETLCMVCGSTGEEVRRMNVAKLRARYPEGFNFEAAAARADERSTG